MDQELRNVVMLIIYREADYKVMNIREVCDLHTRLRRL